MKKQQGEVHVTSRHLQHVVNAANRLVSKARLRITPNNTLRVLEVDAAHVALIQAQAPLAQNHEPERLDDERELAIDLDSLKTALDPVNKVLDEPLRLAYTENKVQVDTPDGHTYRFERQDTSGMTDPKPPEDMIDSLPSVFVVDADDVWDALRRAHKLDAYHVRLSFDGETLTVEHDPNQAKDRDTGGVAYETTIPAQRTWKHEPKDGDESSSLFSIDYLRQVTLASAWQGQAKLHLGNNYPIHAKVHPPEDAQVRYTLAPRIKP